MMHACCRCDGWGSQVSLDENEARKGIEDTCYHCLETGECDCPADVIALREAEDELWYLEARIAEEMDRCVEPWEVDSRLWDRKAELQAKVEGLKIQSPPAVA